MRAKRSSSLAVFLLAGLPVVSALPARGEAEDLVRRGKEAYQVYCADCHGEAGDGKGPAAAELNPRPADLTRIPRRDDGSFPLDRVYQAIDGRDKIPGHEASSMPIWGLGFQELDRDTDQEDEVRGRILQLIEYLKSIQVEPVRSGGS